MKPGDLVVLSDYWERELALVLSVDPENDECLCWQSSGQKDRWKLSFLKTLEVINETR